MNGAPPAPLPAPAEAWGEESPPPGWPPAPPGGAGFDAPLALSPMSPFASGLPSPQAGSPQAEALVRAMLAEEGPLGLSVGVRSSNRDGSSHAVLLGIARGSQAARLPQLRPGLVLREINGQPVATLDDAALARALSDPQRPVRLQRGRGRHSTPPRSLLQRRSLWMASE
jgi:hypothetical protein